MFKTYFLDVITQHYVDFAGRATRKQFWLFALFNFIISIFLYWLGGMNDVFSIIWIVYIVALFLPGLAIAARRLHDIGRSAWWLLLYFLPFIGCIILLVFFVLPSKK